MRELQRSDRLRVARLAEVGLNSGALVHEMRQPLAAIRLALEVAAQEQPSQYLEDALGQVDRLAGLLDRAHHFMQPEPGALVDLELEPVVERVLRLVEHSVRRKNIELIVDVRARTVVRASASLVEQILFNLINNARDSLIERGLGGRLALIVREQAAAAELIVADDGVGVPDGQQTAIFAPYTTTKGSAGTGLGLFVARRLATSLGGRLSVLDAAQTRQLLQPPPAAAFCLRLPLGRLALAEPRPDGGGRPGPEEVIGRIAELRVRPPRIAILGREKWIHEVLVRFLQPVSCAVRGLSAPAPLTIDDTDLLLVVPDNVISIEETLALVGRGETAPSVIAVLPQPAPEETLQALQRGCVDAVKVPTGNLELLVAQAAVLAALRDRREDYESALLLRAWARGEDEAAAMREAVRQADQEGGQLKDVLVCGSSALRHLVGGFACHHVLPDLAAELVEPPGLLFVEPAGVGLTRLLEILPTPDASRIVVCAERLSLREVQHALSRGVFRLVTGIESAPDLARQRLAGIIAQVQARQRLDDVLRTLMRQPLAARTASCGIRRRRVLVVDDEQVIRKILEAALRPTGCELSSCGTGREAIHLLETQSVDLLIADKNLPDLSGVEVARTGRLLHPALAVLIITGYPSQESAEEALTLRADDYLVKPFDVEELVAKVGSLLARQEEPEARPAGGAPRPATVVVAEPDAATQRRLACLLRARGLRVLAAGAPAVALETLRHEAAGVVVVNVDRDLGLEEHALLHEARRADAGLVVLATTTRPDLARTLEALRLGAAALLRQARATPVPAGAGEPEDQPGIEDQVLLDAVVRSLAGEGSS